MCTCTGLALPSSQENLPHHRHQWIMSADGSQGSRGRRTIWTRDQSGSFSVGLPFLFPLWLQVPSVFSLTASVFLSSDSSKNVSPFPTTLPSALLGRRPFSLTRCRPSRRPPTPGPPNTSWFLSSTLPEFQGVGQDADNNQVRMTSLLPSFFRAGWSCVRITLGYYRGITCTAPGIRSGIFLNDSPIFLYPGV